MEVEASASTSRWQPGGCCRCRWVSTRCSRGELLSAHYASRYLARNLDTLQVAAALELGCPRFVTLDSRQARLAVACSLKTVDLPPPKPPVRPPVHCAAASCADALAGTRCATGPAALCPVATRHEAGGSSLFGCSFSSWSSDCSASGGESGDAAIRLYCCGRVGPDGRDARAGAHPRWTRERSRFCAWQGPGRTS